MRIRGCRGKTTAGNANDCKGNDEVDPVLHVIVTEALMRRKKRMPIEAVRTNRSEDAPENGEMPATGLAEPPEASHDNEDHHPDNTAAHFL
jgi:hypothetical protein